MPHPPRVDPGLAPGDHFHFVLGAVLRHARKSQSLSLGGLCEQVPNALDASTLCRYERGSRGLSVGRLYELSLGLHVPVLHIVASAVALIDEVGGGDGVGVALDLRRMSQLSEVVLAPAAHWARCTLTDTAAPHVHVPHTFITDLAARCRITPARLAGLLRRHEVIAEINRHGERS